jgi:plastocyanin
MNAPALSPGIMLASALLAAAATCQAASVTVEILDAAGKPLPDAAVYAEPEAGAPAPKSPRTVEIEQKGRKFIPTVTVIQTGTNISFPNNDTVRHHVYSFSPAKVFELKLYSGEPANPVNFDKPGTVVIGCNIHDQMAAYIHVVPTPYFAKSDAAGKAKLDNLAPGKYRLKAWHSGLPTGTPVAEQALVVANTDGAASINLNVKARTN